MKRGLDAASAARGVSYLWLQNGVSLVARVGFCLLRAADLCGADGRIHHLDSGV